LERDFPLAIDFQLPAEQVEPSSLTDASEPSGNNTSSDTDIPRQESDEDEEAATVGEADVRDTEAAISDTEGSTMATEAPLNSGIDPPQERSGQENQENPTMDPGKPASE
jgi:hypothetical protein